MTQLCTVKLSLRRIYSGRLAVYATRNPVSTVTESFLVESCLLGRSSIPPVKVKGMGSMATMKATALLLVCLVLVATLVDDAEGKSAEPSTKR